MSAGSFPKLAQAFLPLALPPSCFFLPGRTILFGKCSSRLVTMTQEASLGGDTGILKSQFFNKSSCRSHLQMPVLWRKIARCLPTTAVLHRFIFHAYTQTFWIVCLIKVEIKRKTDWHLFYFIYLLFIYLFLTSLLEYNCFTMVC